MWSDYGMTALSLSEEDLEKLSLKGRHGIFALSSALHEGENKGNFYVDGILEGNYSLTGDSYLGILSGDVNIRRQLILNFETEEEKDNFKCLYYLSPIPLEKGLKNGVALALPEVENSPSETEELAAQSSESPAVTNAEKTAVETSPEKTGEPGTASDSGSSSDGKKTEKSGEGLVESSEEVIGIYDNVPN